MLIVRGFLLLSPISGAILVFLTDDRSARTSRPQPRSANVRFTSESGQGRKWSIKAITSALAQFTDVGIWPRQVRRYGRSRSAQPHAAEEPMLSDGARSVAAGMSVRAISADRHSCWCGPPRDATAGKNRGTRGAKGCRHFSPTANQQLRSEANIDVRRLTVSVFERAVESAIGRGLLGRSDHADPWTVVSALFASMFDDHTIEWLNKHGYLRWDRRGQGEAVISAVNERRESRMSLIQGR